MMTWQEQAGVHPQEKGLSCIVFPFVHVDNCKRSQSSVVSVAG